MLKASKWIKLPLLVDVLELEELCQHLHQMVGPFRLFHVQSIVSRGEGEIPLEKFIAEYDGYLSGLKKGIVPIKDLSSPVMSLDEESIHIREVSGERALYQPKLPVIQLQPNKIRYSSEDGAFRSQLYGSDSITWGIQFSFPMIYQDAQTHEIIKTETLENARLFRALQKWVRTSTRATPFIVNGKKQNEPFRLGKKCFEWINLHPQLKSQHITVEHVESNKSGISAEDSGTLHPEEVDA